MVEIVHDMNSDFSEMSQEQFWLLDTSAFRGRNVCGQDDDSLPLHVLVCVYLVETLKISSCDKGHIILLVDLMNGNMIYTVLLSLYELCHEKTCFLHMRKQRHRSAAR